MQKAKSVPLGISSGEEVPVRASFTGFLPKTGAAPRPSWALRGARAETGAAGVALARLCPPLSRKGGARLTAVRAVPDAQQLVEGVQDGALCRAAP